MKHNWERTADKQDYDLNQHHSQYYKYIYIYIYIYITKIFNWEFEQTYMYKYNNKHCTLNTANE